MNKKGFTLVELLAVIILLSVLASIATYSIMSVIKNSKENARKIAENEIMSAAEAYFEENTDKKMVSLCELKNDYLEEDATHPKTGEKINGTNCSGYVLYDSISDFNDKTIEKDGIAGNGSVTMIDSNSSDSFDKSKEYIDSNVDSKSFSLYSVTKFIELFDKYKKDETITDYVLYKDYNPQSKNDACNEGYSYKGLKLPANSKLYLNVTDFKSNFTKYLKEISPNYMCIDKDKYNIRYGTCIKKEINAKNETTYSYMSLKNATNNCE